MTPACASKGSHDDHSENIYRSIKRKRTLQPTRFFLFEGFWGKPLRAKFPVSLSSHVGYTRKLIYATLNKVFFSN